jgi:hypothetical protein
MKNIVKILKFENKAYLLIGILLLIAFIINVTIIGVCPYPDCIHQVYRENTSPLYISAYYLALYGLPLWIILTTFLLLFYSIFKRIVLKDNEYNIIIFRLFWFILSGLIIVVLFAFIFIVSYSNGKFDFWMFPKDSGELLLIMLIISCLLVRKILIERK